ncbi:ATP-binding protein [uncultured Imperialibacter sp.]|uniref:ATP-binding protein n=1 Tax=uncultured Imperialibacter sp. TaxID=1672639 RepID=UPI0030D96D48
MNSIKYRKPNEPAEIQIKSRLKSNYLSISFKDNGTGIDLYTNGSKVFGLYKRFHLNIEGKGMGLFMVKNQVEALGGKIDLRSEVDKGAEFVLRFPLSAA